jgi:TrmH family RNA methyltransferase
MKPAVLEISSRDNPTLMRLRRLAQEPQAYRKFKQLWLEGDHLCRAALARGGTPALCVITTEAWAEPQWRALAQTAPRILRVSAELFKGLSGLESPAFIGFEWPLTSSHALQPDADTVVLDRLQDAGNVGTILRSAAAMGFKQVLAMKGCAALWSPKVLRAGMGAHFGLHLVEGLACEDLQALQVPLVATSSHASAALHELRLPQPCAWVLGHEGQGVQPALMQRCAITVRIPQPGGEESLNVGSAAAICLFESVRQRSGRPLQG